MPRESFKTRFLTLRKKSGLTWEKIGTLFGVSGSMIQKIVAGDYELSELSRVRYTQLLDKYEKETDLQKYFSGIHESMPVRAGGDKQGIDYYIEENQRLRDDIRSLEQSRQTSETTIKFLHEEISKLRQEVSRLKREYEPNRN